MKINLNKASDYIVRQQHFLFFVAVLLLFSFIVWRIGAALDPKPDQTRVNALMQEIQPVEFNEDQIAEIRDRKQSNINIAPDYTDRDNPFVD